MSKIKTIHLLQIFVILLLVLFLTLFWTSNIQNESRQEQVEIKEIKATSDIKKQGELYKKLIDRVGAKKAQEDLFKSGLPFTGQTHLLNHTVGDYLYEKYGPKGLLQCKDYFLSSCYHGFILHAIADGGIPKVAQAFDECRKKGPAVFSQCAHAIGHGFLANVGYKNLTKALKTCDEATRAMPEFPAFNCHDGVFMENIWAVHDGEPSKDRWIKPSDMQYPCDDPRIDLKYVLACWSNQPSLLYQQFQGDIKKVANVCGEVTSEANQKMCFDGLSRQIHPLTEGKASKTLELCSLMPSQKWNNFCLSVNAGASYAVGDRNVPFEICANINTDGKEDCYSRLFSNIRAYVRPNENLKTLCLKVTDIDFRKKCQERKFNYLYGIIEE